MTKPFSAIPSAPGHWLLGSLPQIKKQPFHLYAYDLASRFDGLVRFRLMHKPVLLVANPVTVQTILKARPDTYRRARKTESVFREMSVHGVFSAERADWLRQRQLMNPAFRPGQIREFFPIIQRCTEALCRNLAARPGGNPVQTALMACTADITSVLAFGIDLNTLDRSDHEFQRHLNSLFPMLMYRLHAPFPYWKLFRLRRDRELTESLQYVRRSVAAMIEQARAELAEKSAADRSYRPENLLEAMLTTRAENGQRFTEDELFANVLTLLLAGEDTTANTLAWTIHFLADQGDLQDQVHAEIEANYPRGRPLGYTDLDRFPLTFACARESMRLVPVAPYLLLEAYRDQVVEGYRLPAGVMVMVLLAASGLQELAFRDADRFMPQRWLSLSDGDQKRFASELMPFGYGPRLCPGRQLSFVEMKVALIELLRRFRFRRTAGHEVTESMAFTVVPTNLRVDIDQR